MIKVPLIGLLTLTAATLARADERPVHNLNFPHHTFPFEPADANVPPAVAQKTSGGGCDLVVSRRPDTPYVVTLWEMDAPPLTTAACAVVGRVSYTDLRGPPATLELIATYADNTVARGFMGRWDTVGPEQPFGGTSDGRSFRVAVGSGAGAKPKHLTLRAVLPGTGELNLTSATLCEVSKSASTTNAASRPTSSARPAAAALPDDGPAYSTLADLGPPPSAQSRATTAEWLADALRNRVLAEADLRDAETRFGASSVPAMERRHALKVIDADIAAMRQSLAATPTLPSSDGRGRTLAWANEHFTAAFLTLVGLSLAAIVPLRWLIQRGRGRSIVFGFFALLLAGGVAQLFAAGVAFGMNESADAWASLLGCSAILIVVPALTLRQVRRQYDALELRKLQALDLG